MSFNGAGIKTSGEQRGAAGLSANIFNFFDILTKRIKAEAKSAQGYARSAKSSAGIGNAVYEKIGSAREVVQMGQDTMLNRLINAGNKDEFITYQEIHDYIKFPGNYNKLVKLLGPGGEKLLKKVLAEVNQDCPKAIPISELRNFF